MSSNKDYDCTFKILILGDSGVGKTSLIHMFCEKSFSNSYLSTIGIDSKIKVVELDGAKIRLQLWDTAGQERFRTLTTAYYRGAMGIVLVFDVGNENSFKSIRHWIENVEEKASLNVEQVLVGNKCDIDDDDKAVSYNRGKKHASEFDVPYFETSAKFGNCVDEVFLELTRRMKKQRDLQVQNQQYTSYPKPTFLKNDLDNKKDDDSKGSCC